MTNKTFLTLAVVSAFAFAVFLPMQARATAPIAVTQYATTGTCTNLTVGLWYGKYDATTGGQVSALQNFLHANNYLSVNATGYFGPLTRAAVKAYQQEHGLSADGIVGVNTRAHILAANSNCYPMPVPPVSYAPVVTAISPAAAASGTTVTLIGTGFTNSNIVHFSIGGLSNIASANNGTTLTFTVPSSIGPYCKPGQACALYLQLLNAGTYPVYVENANGTSNTVQFTITNNATQIPN